MNCKENQICRIVNAGPNTNRLCRTIKLCGCMESMFAALFSGGPKWTCEALQHIEDDMEGRTHPPGSVFCIGDQFLRPLGDEGPEDIIREADKPLVEEKLRENA